MSEGAPARLAKALFALYRQCGMSISGREPRLFPHRHLLGIEGLSPDDILQLLDMAEEAVEVSRQVEKKKTTLRGRTQINLFFEASTRTQASFELAGKRLGADVMNMSVASSSIKKGDTLIDTAITLNAMRPDLIVVRHHAAGAVGLLARKVDCSVINAGDGAHEHPTQALLDARTILDRGASLEGLRVAIIGDIAHSRVARSNAHLLSKYGADIVLCGPASLLPRELKSLAPGITLTTDMREAITGAGVIMMLRVQLERQHESAFPASEYFGHYGLRLDHLQLASPDVIVMHPGPINRGREISSEVADSQRSVILNQVENGISVRMAVLEKVLQ